MDSYAKNQFPNRLEVTAIICNDKIDFWHHYQLFHTSSLTYEGNEVYWGEEDGYLKGFQEVNWQAVRVTQLGEQLNN